MPLSVQCPRCNQMVSVADQAAGKRVKCPHCQQPFLAPGLEKSTRDDDDWLKMDDPPAQQPAPIASQPISTTEPLAANPTSAIPTANPDLPGPSQQGPSQQGPSLPGPSQQGPGQQGRTIPVTLPDSALPDSALPELTLPAHFKAPANPPANPPANLQASAGLKDPMEDSFFADLPPDVDDFTSVVESPPPPKRQEPVATELEYATEYRVRCKVCDSLMFAKAAQAGKTVKCSDCLSPITIPPPPKIVQPKKFDIDSAPTFKLEEPATTRLKGTDPHRKSAEQLLAEAARAEEETTVVRYADTPSVKEWLSGIFGIFKDLSVITHWIGLSLVAVVPIVLVISINHPYAYALMFPAGLFFGALVVSCGFAILQSVANGEDQVSEWPLFDPPSWLDELAVAVAAAAVVAAPFAAVAQLFNAGLVGVALTMFAIYGLFPFVLLSMMDMNSPFKPFSPEVARSVTKCEEAWGGLYFSSGLLFALLFLVIVTTKQMGTVGVAISVFAAVAAAFIYFAMIGRLAFAIGQTAGGPTHRPDRETKSAKDS